jgi:hypothetical protein
MRVRITGFFPAVAVAFFTTAGFAQMNAADPWASSEWSPPPGYHGPVFKLSYDYPAAMPLVPPDPPWIRALGAKPISADNALAYVQALKDYIGADMRTLILDYDRWNAQARKWYNLPWMFSIRDPIRGTYHALPQDSSSFPLSNLKKKLITDYVLVYYNDVAAYTLGQFWGKAALNPDFKHTQFADGSIIIKVALTDALANDWSPLDGAVVWDLYPPVLGPSSPTAPTKIVKGTVFQLDIIVKDTKTVPRIHQPGQPDTGTGWVFSTLVYDKSITGDAWTRMVPLGAMWGNDPDLNSVITPNSPLQENVINPMAPLYSVETLGYGGRLSGPNDGAVSVNNIIDGQLVPRARISSCLSCHGVAEWPLKSSLVPSVNGGANNPSDPDNSFSYFLKPGTVEFNRWLQDRPGNVPQDAGSVALDYDMNMTIKALPLWLKYTTRNNPAALTELLTQIPSHLQKLLLEPEKATKTGRIVH